MGHSVFVCTEDPCGSFFMHAIANETDFSCDEGTEHV